MNRKDPLPRVRELCFALLDVNETVSHGAPTFWAGGKRTFAMFVEAGTHHHGGRPAVWIKATHDGQEAARQMAPERYFAPPYLGPSGWIGAFLDGPEDWDEIAELLEEGWRLAAPKRLLARSLSAPTPVAVPTSSGKKAPPMGAVAKKVIAKKAVAKKTSVKKEPAKEPAAKTPAVGKSVAKKAAAKKAAQKR